MEKRTTKNDGLMITDRVDQIIQFALLVAGEEDDFINRQLGPVHLIKYVYLADLAHAEEFGETFTGVPWQFYKFGPWDLGVCQRIEPALQQVGAVKQSFQSSYGEEDWVRWHLTSAQGLDYLEKKLPLPVVSAIRKNVHQYGADTSNLLAFVYGTRPMRRAAPMETLIFSDLKRPRTEEPAEQQDSGEISRKKAKLLKQKMQQLRELSARKFAEKKGKGLVPPPVAPRYDDVYFSGLEWLDSLAGPDLPEGEMEVVFSDSVWKSPARMDDEVS